MIEFNYTLLIQFFNFLILLFLLNIFLFKPVLKAINKRENTLGSLFDRVERVKQEVAKLEQAYTEGATERRKPILEEREIALKETQQSSMRLIEQARAELSEQLAKVKAEIETEGQKISEALKGEVEKLSSEVAQKILQRSL